MNQGMIIVPGKTHFSSIKGNIQDGVQLRCGTCHCACICNCPSTCANCKKHIDPAFIRAYAAR